MRIAHSDAILHIPWMVLAQVVIICLRSSAPRPGAIIEGLENPCFALKEREESAFALGLSDPPLLLSFFSTFSSSPST